MVEVPEHLLRRAKERRAALTGGAAPAPAEGGDAPAAESAAAPAPVEAAVPAAAATPVVPEAPAPPSAAYLADQAVRRTRVPIWVTPVLLVLPLWAILYAGAFGDRTAHEAEDPRQVGARVYRSAGCASCHGANGEGGAGPALAGDAVEQTFPDAAAHIEWIKTGSIGTPAAPLPYGDPSRPGGQRLSRGGMPSFANQLSEEEIEAVVQYEREEL